MKKLMANTLRRIGEISFTPMYERMNQQLTTLRQEQLAQHKRQQLNLGLPGKEAQVQLYLRYREMARCKELPLPKLDEVGFRRYSQFEEDGILLFLFGIVGTTNKTVVELCAGDGIECMAANLIINHGWWGHLFDGAEANVASAQRFYSESRDTWLYPPKFNHAWITAENVNDLIRASGITGGIDLLSLDLDGVDYWIWNAIECIQPRVVVCETHGIIPPDDALTVPYDPKFTIETRDHHSASLSAMNALAIRKGYRLVGTHRYGFNAFFVRNGIADDLLAAVTPADCLNDPFTLNSRAERWPKVKDLDWVRV